MLLVQLLTLKTPNFYNLTCLICHLVIGGQFRVVEILYSPGTLDHRLLSEIKKNCGDEFLWKMADITKPLSAQSIDKIPGRLIQLIFLGKNREFEKNQLTTFFPNSYRIFIFHSHNNEIPMPMLSQSKTLHKSNMNSIALLHNSANDSIQGFLMNDDDLSLFDDQIQVKQKNQNDITINSKEIFKNIFGKREQMQAFGIIDPTIIICYYIDLPIKAWKFGLFYQFVAKFFLTQLNMNFINIKCNGKNRYLRHISKPVYNELSLEMESVAM